MIYELNHVGIFVRDLDASLAYWLGTLGAVVVWRNVIPATSTDVVYLQVGGGLVELLHPQLPEPDRRWGLDHVAFLSDDLDADFARVLAAGYPGLTTPWVAGTGVGRLAFVEAPDGIRVELLQRDLPLRSAVGSSSPVSAIDAVDVAASDPAATVRFFADVMGMAVREQEPRPVLTHGLDAVAVHRADPYAAAGLRSLTLRLARSGATMPERLDDPDGVAVEFVAAPVE